MEKKFLVYKSSAGSGKTFVLARTYLRIALAKPNPVLFGQILAITFTVKAASEMKERIIRYLSIISKGGELRGDIKAMRDALIGDLGISEPKLQEKSKTLLSAILHNYGQFSVLTIDKFVNRLVRSFASDLGFTTDFDIELDTLRLSTEAVETLLQQAGVNEELTEFLLEFLRDRVANDKSWKIETPLTALAIHLNSEEFYFQAKKLEMLTAPDMAALKQNLDERLLGFQNSIQSQAKEAIELIDKNGLTADDFHRKKTGIHGYFTKVANGDIETAFSPNSWVITTIDENKWYKGASHPVIDQVKSVLLDKFNTIQNMQSKAREMRFLEVIAQTLYTLGVINELRVCLEQVKLEENVQMLSDFYQTISRNILAERAPFIYERIGNRYKHVLIDEFQDTSLLQWSTFVPLIENALAEDHTNLVVGDAKQSIYRFRGGEPELFQSLHPENETLPSLLQNQVSEVKLTHNFRSAKTIVEFNNRLFRLLANSLLSEELQAVYQDLEQKPVKQEEGFIQMKLMAEEREVWINQVHQWIEQNVSERGYAYGDICLLFHRNDHASKFASELLNKGVPLVSDESLLLINDANVQAIIATLEAVRNSGDRFLLVRWLTRLQQVGCLTSPLHETARDLKAKKYVDFNRTAQQIGLELRAHQLLSGTTYEQMLIIIRALRLDEENVFVRKLLDLSLQYEQQATYLRMSFLQYWKDEGQGLSIDLSGGNAVRVLSIHKSKGLQFPIVILPLLGANLSKLTHDRVWIDIEEEEIPLDTALVDVRKLRETDHEHVFDNESDRSALDQLNVLYVAMTRAEEKLYLMGSDLENKDKFMEPEALSVLATFKEWNPETKEIRIGEDRQH